MIPLPGLAVLSLATLLASAPPAEGPAEFTGLAKDYEANVRPVLKQYCLKCHSTAEQEGDLDLERFAKFDDVKRDARVWQKVVEMLDNGEMPPKKSRALSGEERGRLRGWARATLDAMARAQAGDPGPVVLRRLNNVDYTNTVRDLTGVDLLPAREFPADEAAGEGFSNVGEALAMSPAMLDKYLAAAKGIASHAVLLPVGFRFSEKTTRPDWTDEIMAKIRAIYGRHTDPEGSTRVNLQGLVWETNAGGRIPLKPYLAALVANRDALASGKTNTAEVAARQHLSPKYLGIVWNLLNDKDSSPILDPVRARYRSAGASDVDALVEAIRQWQVVLTKFKSVGHFKPWQEAQDPLVDSQTFRVKLPTSASKDVVLRLVTHDAGDGAEGDLVEWRQPRLESPGRQPILLRDLRDGLQGWARLRQTLPDAAKYLSAVEELRTAGPSADTAAIATRRSLDPLMLAAWRDYLGVSGEDKLRIETLFTERIERSGAYDFIKTWGPPATPNVSANSSDMQVRVPGIMRPHGVCVHPAPTRNVAVGWRSPIAGVVRIEYLVERAHPECGNGISWSIELRRGGERRRLAAGERPGPVKATPIENVTVHKGDLISLVVGPRGDHSCDLTAVDLTVVASGENAGRWSLAGDVSGDLLAGNPHADRLGHPEIWYFYHEKIDPESLGSYASIPAGSLLDRWRDEPRREERDRLASALGALLAAEPSGGDANSPDAVLARQLRSFSGPLLGRIDVSRIAGDARSRHAVPVEGGQAYGLPRSHFGSHPRGKPGDPTSLYAQAPAVIECRLPADLIAGREFVVDALLDPREGESGSVQVEATLDQSPTGTHLVAGLPIVSRGGTIARKRLETWFNDFRRTFPAALCYSQIVPVDEVVTLALYHREDEPLERLMLDESESKELDRLWDELEFVSQEAFKVEIGYVQFMEYTTQDGDPNLFKPLKKPIAEKAAALRRQLVAVEPKQLDALVAFADRAYRRPLSTGEKDGLRSLYASLRKQDLDHEAAFRLTLAAF